MRHVDEDVLTRVALGELQPDAGAAEHLEQCEHCRAELAALTAVVTAGRAGGPLEAPPARVWDRAAAEIGAAGPGRPTDVATAGRVRPAGAPVAGRAGSTRPPGRRERPRRGVLSRAAWLAAGLAAGIAGTVGVLQWQETPEVTPVATADLEPLPGWAETGAARVEEVDGRLLLHVEVSGDVPDAYREVWLLDESVSQLVSVGLLVGDRGTYDLPDGLDLQELAVVDVSHEPFDGDPAHSGQSIVRGRLGT